MAKSHNFRDFIVCPDFDVTVRGLFVESGVGVRHLVVIIFLCVARLKNGDFQKEASAVWNGCCFVGLRINGNLFQFGVDD
jgi:hypothetical protein